SDAVFPHDSGHSVAPTRDTIPQQRLMHPWVPVALVAGLVYFDDPLQKFGVIEIPLAFAPLQPGIVATTSNTQFPAQHSNRALLRVLLDEPESYDFFPGKILSAFLSTAFSSL